MGRALPVDFMERVVVWPGNSNEPGYINLHWKPPDGRGHGLRGKPFKELQEFMDFAQYATGKPTVYKEIFFCLSTQKEMGKLVHNRATAHRHHSKVLSLKSIWLDIDVKPEKGYPTLDAAFGGLDALRKGANLPAPSALVLSGGGIHCYWISDKPLTEAQWRPYAEGLKAEALRLELKCDAGLTTDPVRVLRVPGTFNNKLDKPRVVKLVHLGESYDFSTSLAMLPAAAPVRPVTATVTKTALQVQPPAFDLTGWGPPPAWQPDPASDNLSAGIGDAARLDLPLDPSEMLKRCEHFKDCETTHGAAHGQGLWALTLLAATFFEDGRALAHNWSKGYPSYVPEETDAKYDEKVKAQAERNLGWPSCSAFEGEGAKCKACPFYQKVRSPLGLAGRVVLPFAPRAVAAPPPLDLDLELPDGFTVNSDGHICEIVERDMADGSTTETELPLFMSQLRNFVPQSGDRRLNFETSLDGENWGRVSVAEFPDMVTEQSLIRALRRDGVKPHAHHQKRINHFMTSFLAKLDHAKSRIQTISFGWLRKLDTGSLPVGFAYGGKVYMSDGTTQVAGVSDAQLERLYSPVGKPEPWVQALKLVTDQNHPALEVIAAAGFGGPLMFGTGQYNCVGCAWSPDSAAHKSTSVAIGAAVWGSPKITKERPLASSQKGIIRKLGHLKNIPVYWDEINSAEKMDEVQEILGQLTEGGGGSKLRQDRTLYDVEEWQTLMVVGANKSLMSNIMRTVTDTDAQLQRVYEFQVEKRSDTVPGHVASRLIAELDHNYGHMGVRYAELLGRNPAAIDAMVKDTMKAFEDVTRPNSVERFRQSFAVACFCGAKLANQLGCSFHIQEMWEYLITEFMGQRRVIAGANIVAGTVTNTANAVTQFLKASTRNVLWIANMPSRKPGRPDAIVHLGGPNLEQRDPVHVRFVVNDRMMQLSKQRFSDYLAWAKHTPRTVIDALIKHFDAKIVTRASLAQGSGVVGGREPVIEIPVPPGSPFELDLFTKTAIDERPVGAGGEIGDAPPLVPDAPVAFGDVTAPVTLQKPRFDTISCPISEMPQREAQRQRQETGLLSAMEQAAKDLSKC